MSEKTFALKYTGVQATTFARPGVGHLEPGDTFTVPESALLAFIRRGDIEHDGDCPRPPCKCGQEPKTEAAQAAGSGSSGKPKGTRRGASPSAQHAQDDATA